MVINSYKDVLKMELREEDSRLDAWNFREFLESKEVVTAKRLASKLGEDTELMIPYVIDWIDSSRDNDLILPYSASYLYIKGGITRIQIHHYKSKYCKGEVVGMEELIAGSIAVDEFIADYALAKFRQRYFNYIKQENKRLRAVQG